MDPRIRAEHDDSLQGRMIRAARLDPGVYEEVKDDPRALAQALAVVLLAAVATGIGFGHGDLGLIATGIAFALAGWCVTAYLTWLIGARVFPEPLPPEVPAHAPPGAHPRNTTAPTPAHLLRTIGFANSPGILRMLAVLPELRVLVLLGSTLWILCATVVAIREGLGYRSTRRAAAVYLGIQLLIAPLLLLFIDPQMPETP